jgi:hypothetical protein
LFTQEILRAASFALASAGNNNPASIAMIAITTRSSISVNPKIFDGGKTTIIIFFSPLSIHNNIDNLNSSIFKLFINKSPIISIDFEINSYPKNINQPKAGIFKLC